MRNNSLLDEIAHGTYASLFGGQGEPAWCAFVSPDPFRNTGDPSRIGPDNGIDQVEEAVVVILVSDQQQGVVLPQRRSLF